MGTIFNDGKVDFSKIRGAGIDGQNGVAYLQGETHTSMEKFRIVEDATTEKAGEEKQFINSRKTPFLRTTLTNIAGACISATKIAIFAGTTLLQPAIDLANAGALHDDNVGTRKEKKVGHTEQTFGKPWKLLELLNEFTEKLLSHAFDTNR